MPTPGIRSLYSAPAVRFPLCFIGKSADCKRVDLLACSSCRPRELLNVRSRLARRILAAGHYRMDGPWGGSYRSIAMALSPMAAMGLWLGFSPGALLLIGFFDGTHAISAGEDPIHSGDVLFVRDNDHSPSPIGWFVRARVANPPTWRIDTHAELIITAGWALREALEVPNDREAAMRRSVTTLHGFFIAWRGVLFGMRTGHSAGSRVAAVSGTLSFGQLRARSWDRSHHGNRGFSSLGTVLSLAGGPRFARMAVVSAAQPIQVREQLGGC